MISTALHARHRARWDHGCLPPSSTIMRKTDLRRMIYSAHTATRHDGSTDPDCDHWQQLEDHLRNVAARAAEFAAAFHVADWARLAGQWHDLSAPSTGTGHHAFSRAPEPRRKTESADPQITCNDSTPFASPQDCLRPAYNDDTPDSIRLMTCQLVTRSGRSW
jgi:hypothetical protein